MYNVRSLGCHLTSLLLKFKFKLRPDRRFLYTTNSYALVTDTIFSTVSGNKGKINKQELKL